MKTFAFVWSVLGLLCLLITSYVESVDDSSGGASVKSDLPHESCMVPRTSSPNLLFIMTDQHIFHALGFIQARMPEFDGKLHVRTPNIDALAQRGVHFENAYCVSPFCGPARASVKTGSTVQQHGVLNNECYNRRVYTRMNIIENRIKKQVSFEQVLVEQGFVAENYGKWHAPLRLYMERNNSSKQAITYNLYDKLEQPNFEKYMDEDQFYPPAVKFMVEKDNLTIGFRNGSQYNNLSGFPYTPAIRIDTRYGYPTNTPLTTKAGFEEWQISERYCCGVDDLPDGYSLTDVTGKWALKALQRLATNKTQPFVLSVHFLSPHPPVIAPPEYFSYYFDQRNKLPVPISMKDAMLNSAYKKYGSRRLIEKLGIKYPFNDKSKMAELTAAYYAMIEEVDEWVGRLIEVVDQMQIRENTMIIFTADHGEMLGAHGLVEKQVLLEEAARVPLIISFPGNSSMGTTIRQPVSHLDLHSTILDCLGVGDLDESSGASLRRFVDGLSYNKEFDESIVVAEADYRIPLKENKFDRKLGTYPNFMIRKGKYKLILTKLASSPVLDMMYDLETDPNEMMNLIGKKGYRASDSVIGKAEHLKILLLEWLKRMDGPDKVYSDPKYNLNEGRGDIIEIRERRTWRAINYWESDTTLNFGPLVLVDGNYTRNEYFYVGQLLKTTRPLRLDNIHIEGTDSGLFSVDRTTATVSKTGYVRIKVSLISSQPNPFDRSDIDAWMEFGTSYKGNRSIPIVFEE